jgi:tripartite-type tricarboxylate transporter receptor subunit TctC
MADFVPGYEASAWVGLGAPKATPDAIIDVLNRQVNEGLADPAIKASIGRLVGTTLPVSPAEFGRLFAEDTAKWGKVIRAANIKAE